MEGVKRYTKVDEIKERFGEFLSKIGSLFKKKEYEPIMTDEQAKIYVEEHTKSLPKLAKFGDPVPKAEKKSNFVPGISDVKLAHAEPIEIPEK